jgi:uncharacterized protein (TIRG00374 family)
MKRFRKLSSFVISAVLIGVLASYAPWAKVGHILSDFDLSTILILIGLSLLYYALKTLRFWYLLRALEIYKPLPIVAISYMSAQPVSLLPAGEVYRSYALQRYAGVPVKQSASQFTLQGVLEGGAMTLLMVVSALTLGTLRLAALALLVVFLVIVFCIQRGYLANAGRTLNKLPFVNLTEHAIEDFSQQNRAVLTRRWLPLLSGMSLLIEVVGSAIAYVSVVGIGGHINVFQAALLYIVPVIVGFLSLLPGGIGLSEQSAIGVLYLSGTPLALAVAATLIMRVTIVGLGVIYGLAASLIAHVLLARNELSH